MKVLITGAAGFIGSHVVLKLLPEDYQVVGLDNINDYYDPQLKENRLKRAGIEANELIENKLVQSDEFENYRFVKTELKDRDYINQLFSEEQFDYVVHLAAQAGVRYSLTNPHAYMESNWIGFLNILEACRHNQVKHLTYASSSSVYGLNESMPFSTSDNIDHPISLYAASKKSNELMAHTYSYLYQLPTTGLRFFTVYGPWGRPDMALFKFTKAILEDQPIDVYNNGHMQRDFTYIDDIVEGIYRVMKNIPQPNPEWSGENPDPETSVAPYKVYNIGNNSPVQLMDFIRAIEEVLGKEAEKNFMPIQPGDVPATWADVTPLIDELGYKPDTDVKQGVRNFIEWYREYYCK